MMHWSVVLSSIHLIGRRYSKKGHAVRKSKKNGVRNNLRVKHTNSEVSRSQFDCGKLTDPLRQSSTLLKIRYDCNC
eukprot:scaffold29255_cov37-Attheya_sp.AAC.3